MKKILATTIAYVSIVLTVHATADLGYLITSNDTLLCKNIKTGLNNMCVTLVDGQKQKIDKDNVKTFYIDGRKFDKMPEYINGKTTGREKFMEMLCQRNGLKLYKNTFYCCGGWNTSSQKLDAAGEKTILLVYKDNDYYLQFDNRNAKSLSEYFHLKDLRME